MTSYRRHVARHPDALSRALRQVRRHSMETGPLREFQIAVTLGDVFMRFAEGATKILRGPHQMVLHTEAGPWGCSDKVVAYGTSLPGSTVLRCLDHPLIHNPFVTELTSEDLPDGGFCTSLDQCHRDVLAVADGRPASVRVSQVIKGEVVSRIIPPAEAGTSIPPAECPDCSHPHVEGQRCTAATAGPFPCGCTS